VVLVLGVSRCAGLLFQCDYAFIAIVALAVGLFFDLAQSCVNLRWLGQQSEMAISDSVKKLPSAPGISR